MIKLSVSIYLGKLQDIGYIPRVESKLDYQKLNVKFSVFNICPSTITDNTVGTPRVPAPQFNVEVVANERNFKTPQL